MAESIIEVGNLCKTFGKFPVLKDISLTVFEGEIFGLLGLNGAGKTTLIKSMLHLIKPQKGEIKYKGRPLLPSHIYKEFGYLPERFMPPLEITAKELLEFLGMSLGVNLLTVSFLLEKFNLGGRKKIKYYSRGMVQRLGLCCALLKSPEVIILDEPTLGLDPLGQRDILKLLLDINREGTTIFFSSHNLLQVERICHRIAIIKKGEIMFCGKIEELKASHATESFEEAFLKETNHSNNEDNRLNIF